MGNARRIFLVLFLLLAPAPATGGDVAGRLYRDADRNTLSTHQQPSWWSEEGLPGVPVQLLGSAGTRVADTTPSGYFWFPDVEEGSHLLQLGLPETPPPTCRSHNRSRRLPAAIAEGRIKLVAFGDSNGVLGSPRPYPDRLAERLQAFCPVTLANVSVPGSTSDEWLPGGPFFDGRLAPELADADVITFTLGGNDLLLADTRRPLPERLLEVWYNLLVIAVSIQAAHPDADLVYVTYPVFADSLLWEDLVGPILWPTVRNLNYVVFYWLRAALAQMPSLLIADVLGSFTPGERVDDYLDDPIHPNDLGHQRYADEAFLALGGVIVRDAEPIGLYPFGFADE